MMPVQLYYTNVRAAKMSQIVFAAPPEQAASLAISATYRAFSTTYLRGIDKRAEVLYNQFATGKETCRLKL